MYVNRLVREASPYLLQHAHNPVDWFPWGEEAFALALAEDKPVFLSIGYTTCHWRHVMERESVENESIAALINRHYVSIKVDREQFPQESTLLFLLDQARRDDDEAALDAVLASLANMNDGGIHDQIGGGFHRYSIDRFWQVPHFEKMLYTRRDLHEPLPKVPG